ncbi:MAG: hypothetical protein J1F29_03695 [Lentimicrobiaceae bacterium]|nr:hypothetical protein [Lentimicrobiaceae bacterium]
MSRLEKIYQALQTLESEGLGLNIEQKAQLREAEEEIIRREILPVLTEKIEPLLNQIERELVLVVDYNPKQPLKVSLSRRRIVFPGAVEIKAESKAKFPSSDNQSTTKDESASKKILCVTMPNGRIIKYPKAKDTFIEVIKEIGVERIRPLEITCCKIPIISNKYDAKYGRAQHPIGDGWLVLTNSSTHNKKRILDYIARRLNIPLRVEMLIPAYTEENLKGKRAMFSLNGSEPLNKRNAVYEVIKKFVEEHPDSTFEDIEIFFPRRLQGGYGVVVLEEEYQYRIAQGQNADGCYFIDKPFTDSRGRKFYVCNQWGYNFTAFQKHIENKLGWVLVEV